MRIFDKWFLKQDKKPSPTEPPSKPEEDLKAYILIGIDKDDKVFVKTNYLPTCQDDIAELLFLSNSGSLLNNLLQNIAIGAHESTDLEYIAEKVYNMMFEQFGEQGRGPEPESESPQQEDDDEPVVDPCFVFKQGTSNEFKG